MRVFFAIGPTSYHPFADPNQALEFVDKVMAEGKSPGWGWRIMTLTVKSVEDALIDYKESIND